MKKNDIKESFVDGISGLSYIWHKAETDIVEGYQCWSAKDQFGCTDYFVLKEGLIVKGPYKTIKETCNALTEAEEEPKEEVVKVDDIDIIEKDDGVYTTAGIVDNLYQLISSQTELIRKLQDTLLYCDDQGKKDAVVVLDEIIACGNNNLGKIQGILAEINSNGEEIMDGQEEVFTDNSGDDFEKDFEDIDFDFEDIKPNEEQIPKEVKDDDKDEEEDFDLEDEEEKDIVAKKDGKVESLGGNDEISQVLAERYDMEDRDNLPVIF